MKINFLNLIRSLINPKKNKGEDEVKGNFNTSISLKNSTNPIYEHKIDFTGYTQESGMPLPTPPKEYTELFFKYFPKEATPAAAVAYGENQTYNPKAVNVNTNNTRDLGLMQINEATFRGLQTRPYWKDRMKELGLENAPPEVLFDPEINLKVAKLIHEDETMAGAEPFSRWYGWREKPIGRGINLREMIKKTIKK